MVTVSKARNNADMLARALRIAIFLSLCAVCAWVYFWWPRSNWLAAIGVLFFLSTVPLNLARTFWLSAQSAHVKPLFTGGLDSAGVAQLVLSHSKTSVKVWIAAWWAEVKSATATFLGHQPFASQAVPDYLHDQFGSKGRRGVVFIHGFICNRGLWNPWMKTLRLQNRAFAAVSLEPVFGQIDDYVRLVEDAVARVTATTGLPPLLVCHSMGGLAARAWLRASPESDPLANEKRIHQVVTIGTPHHGTLLGAAHYPPNAAQMKFKSPWLVALAQDEALASPQRNRLFTCFYSNCDNIVFPTATASLAGANNRAVQGVAHLAMAYDANVMAETLSKL